MPSITSLTNKLGREYPQFRFVPGEVFRWSPGERTIYYDTASTDLTTLLHELAHALLRHEAYTRDIELLGLERDAWNHASAVLSPKYEITIDQDIIEEALDTYRDWVHARSICPACQATGVQSKQYAYTCIACGSRWRVNEARSCALRRFTT